MANEKCQMTNGKSMYSVVPSFDPAMLESVLSRHIAGNSLAVTNQLVLVSGNALGCAQMSLTFGL